MNKVFFNAFLAAIPVILAYTVMWLARSRARRELRYAFAALVLPVWFVFLPNTCYLITEWRHYLLTLDVQNLYVRTQLDNHLYAPLFAASLFYMLYSGFGMVMFTLAVRPIEHLAAKRGFPIWLWAIPFFVSVSLGVYLGLVHRFNSWDFLLHPDHVFHVIVDTAGHRRLPAFIMAFGGFLWLAYEMLDLWVDGVSERWSKVTGRRVHLGPKID